MTIDFRSNPNCQRGLSLIELMIAATLGLLVIGAIGGVFLSTSRNYTQDEMLSRMQENARYAMHVLSEDLSMSGYWGPLISGEDINTSIRSCDPSSTDPACLGLSQGSSLSVDSSKDCSPGTAGTTPWATSIASPIEFMSGVASGSAANASFGCIDASEFLAGSDILVVKRVEGARLASTRDDSNDNGEIFIRTDGAEAMLFAYSDALNVSEGADISDWRYSSRVYYVRHYFLAPGDNIPTLVRETLSGNAMDTEAGGVAQGIEYFHVMFGVDTDGDAISNLYVSDPSLVELDNVTSARVYVLVRSMAGDPSYVNNKSYQLGDVVKDFSGNPDNYYRRVFAATVTLRNQRSRILTTGG